MEVVKLLLNAGADPKLADRNGDTALHSATLLGRGDVVQLLLNAGAEANKAGETSL